MASLSNRQSILRPTSNRAATAQLGQSQQPVPSLLSGRALAGQLGPGRLRPITVDILTPRKLALPVPLPDFWQLKAEADRQQAARRPLTPKEAGYPIPFLSPAEQAQRRQAAAKAQQELKTRTQAAYSKIMGIAFLAPWAATKGKPTQAKASAIAPGPDAFMPAAFWHTQAPHWSDCCNTVKRMFKEWKGIGKEPYSRFYIAREQGKTLRAGKDALTGIQKLDEYMALHKPVMAGVTHTFGMKIKSKKHLEIEYPLNEGTTDHFIAIVGVGYEKGRKYYRFFDVGTEDPKRGTSKLNKLYLNANTGFYVGYSQATYKTYTLSQLRF